MTLLSDIEESGECAAPSTHAKMHMLAQMAEALEDEAAGLYRRAAIYEEEEFLLAREIAERQTEINRLSLKLNALCADRDALLARITALTGEAAALREEVYCNEEARALDAIEQAGGLRTAAGDLEGDAESAVPRSFYFRRAEAADMAD
jgi:septal ring factor EnvC (AmiA/AmiB activator)